MDGPRHNPDRRTGLAELIGQRDQCRQMAASYEVPLSGVEERLDELNQEIEKRCEQ
jgi:hypothetical protein